MANRFLLCAGEGPLWLLLIRQINGSMLMVYVEGGGGSGSDLRKKCWCCWGGWRGQAEYIWWARVSMAGLVGDTNAACHLGQGSRRAYLHSYLYPRSPNPCPYHLWRQCSVRCASVHWPVIYRGRLHGPSGVSPIYQSGHTVDSSTGISHIHKRISWFLLFDLRIIKAQLIFWTCHVQRMSVSLNRISEVHPNIWNFFPGKVLTKKRLKNFVWNVTVTDLKFATKFWHLLPFEDVKSIMQWIWHLTAKYNFCGVVHEIAANEDSCDCDDQKGAWPPPFAAIISTLNKIHIYK